MDKKNESFHSASRSGNKEKQRKVNKLYNILITAVVVLIIIVAITIFSGNDEDLASNSPEETKTENTASDNKDKESESETEADKGEAKEDADSEKEESEDSVEEEQPVEGNETVIEEDVEADSNVAKSYQNDGWQPVGTSQSGEHTAVYDKSSVDWAEMTAALAYATGIDGSNMTIWHLGNGGSPNKAVGTVSAKNDPQTYRVNLEWVDGSGWKPVKVQELKVNDKKN